MVHFEVQSGSRLQWFQIKLFLFCYYFNFFLFSVFINHIYFSLVLLIEVIIQSVEFIFFMVSCSPPVTLF